MSVIPPIPPATKVTPILGSLSMICIVMVALCVATGLSSGELENKILIPANILLSNLRANIKKLGEEENKKTNSVTIMNNVIIESTSSSVIRIITPTKSQKMQIPKSEVQIKYVYPTTNPTILQQSKEMQARFEEMKKQNEQSFKEFCDKMPSASICKK